MILVPDDTKENTIQYLLPDDTKENTKRYNREL